MRLTATQQIVAMCVKKIVAKLVSNRKAGARVMRAGGVARVVLGVVKKYEATFLRKVLQLAVEAVLEIAAAGAQPFSFQIYDLQRIDRCCVAVPLHQIVGNAAGQDLPLPFDTPIKLRHRRLPEAAVQSGLQGDQSLDRLLQDCGKSPGIRRRFRGPAVCLSRVRMPLDGWARFLATAWHQQ